MNKLTPLLLLSLTFCPLFSRSKLVYPKEDSQSRVLADSILHETDLKVHKIDSVFDTDKRQQKRTKATGFRIQIYSGGNSRIAKSTAEKIALLSESYFPELAVYTHFIAPHWVCRVGDFKTQAEAQSYLEKFRKTKAFRESYIVRGTIYLYH